MVANRIALIEDHAALRQTLLTGLSAAGFVVEAVGDGDRGWNLVAEARHDLIITDRMLPGIGGLELVRRLRRAGSRVPVLMLTAMDTVQDKVDGLDAGADDYLVKPFASEELLARVRTLLRRHSGGGVDPVMSVGDLELDPAARSVRRAGRRIDLTPKEFALAELLFSQRDQVVTWGEIQQRIYPEATVVERNVVEVLVGRLRKKLVAAGEPPLIHTRRGLGYRLTCNPNADER